MKATLTFTTRQQAEDFAKAWSRKTLTGHTVSAGMQNVQVTVWNVTDQLKEWIETYVNQK